MLVSSTMFNRHDNVGWFIEGMFLKADFRHILSVKPRCISFAWTYSIYEEGEISENYKKKKNEKFLLTVGFETPIFRLRSGHAIRCARKSDTYRASKS